MTKINLIVNIISMLLIITAFVFVGIYPCIQEHNPSLADKLQVWYQLAEVLVANEETKTDKTGTDKKKTATSSLVDQAEYLKVPLTENVAASLVQKAYNQSKVK